MLTVCATLVLAAGLAVVWVRVVQTLTEPSTGPKTVGQPGALVWNGRVFTSPTQLKAYLTSKGLSYSRWAARHPTAFGAAPTAAGHTTTSKTTTKTNKPSKPATQTVAAPTTASSKSSRTLTSTLLTMLLLVAGVAVGGSAMIPARHAPAAVQHFYASPDRRMVALATSAAILLGFGVSIFLN